MQVLLCRSDWSQSDEGKVSQPIEFVPPKSSRSWICTVYWISVNIHLQIRTLIQLHLTDSDTPVKQSFVLIKNDQSKRHFKFPQCHNIWPTSIIRTPAVNLGAWPMYPPISSVCKIMPRLHLKKWVPVGKRQHCDAFKNSKTSTFGNGFFQKLWGWKKQLYNIYP